MVSSHQFKGAYKGVIGSHGVEAAKGSPEGSQMGSPKGPNLGSPDKRTTLGPTSAVSATLLNLEGAWILRSWSGCLSEPPRDEGVWAWLRSLPTTPYDSGIPSDAPLTSSGLLSSDSWRSRPPLDLQKWSKMGHFWGVLRSGIPPRWRVLPKVRGFLAPSWVLLNTPSEPPLERRVLIGELQKWYPCLSPVQRV